jgi:hypothetical protein
MSLTVNHKYPQPHEQHEQHHHQDFVYKKPSVEKAQEMSNVIMPNPVHVATTTKSDSGEFNFSSTTVAGTVAIDNSSDHQVNVETTTKNQSFDPRIMNLDSLERDIDEINEIDERSDENIIF